MVKNQLLERLQELGELIEQFCTEDDPRLFLEKLLSDLETDGIQSDQE